LQSVPSELDQGPNSTPATIQLCTAYVALTLHENSQFMRIHAVSAFGQWHLRKRTPAQLPTTRGKAGRMTEVEK